MRMGSSSNHVQAPRKGVWTKEEDLLLTKCIEKYGERKWHQVPSLAGLNRCRKSCRLRWLNYLRPNIKRGEFTEDEIDLILRLHKLIGNRWSLIAGRIPGRTANDIKNYWNTHLHKRLAERIEAIKEHEEPEKSPDTPQVPDVVKPRPLTFPRTSAPPSRTDRNSIDPNEKKFDPMASSRSALSPSSSSDTDWWVNLLAEANGTCPGLSNGSGGSGGLNFEDMSYVPGEDNKNHGGGEGWSRDEDQFFGLEMEFWGLGGFHEFGSLSHIDCKHRMNEG